MFDRILYDAPVPFSESRRVILRTLITAYSVLAPLMNPANPFSVSSGEDWWSQLQIMNNTAEESPICTAAFLSDQAGEKMRNRVT